MKELTPEELSVISNVQSLLQEIQSMAGGQSAGQAGVAAGPGGTAGQVTMEEEEEEAPAAPPAPPAPLKKEDEDEDDEGTGRMEGAPANVAKPTTVVKRGKAAKAIIQGEPDASTGSSDADERVEDLPEWDEDNVDVIAKAIAKLAGLNIRKSARPQNPLVATLANISQAMKAISERQSMQDRVLNDMLEGLGVAKQLETAQPRARSAAIQTMPQNNDYVMKEFVNALASVMKGEGEGKGSVVADSTSDLSQSEVVHKGMGELALGLSKVAGQLWNPDLGK